MPSHDVYCAKCNHDATSSRRTVNSLQYPFRLTDAPLASAVELRALQVIVVTVMTGVVLMVVVVFVVLGLLDNIVSRTSSKQKAAMLIMSHGKEAKKYTNTDSLFNQ